MKSKSKGLVIMTMAILPLVAAARTVPASHGRAVVWSDGPCFPLFRGSVQNSCSTVKSYQLPLVVDNFNAKTVRVTANGATASNNVGCAAVAMNRTLTIMASTPQLFLPSFGSPQIITLTGISVPLSGFMYVNCNVSPGGRIYVVDYNL